MQEIQPFKKSTNLKVEKASANWKNFSIKVELLTPTQTFFCILFLTC